MHHPAIIAILALLLALAGCRPGASQWREYEEITTGAPVPAAPPHALAPARPAGLALNWQTPAGWHAQPAGGMRLGVFTVARDGRTGTCAIIRMGAAAGDLPAATRRWLQQLGQPEPEERALGEFLSRQEKIRSAADWPGTLVDFTTWTSPAPETDSLLAVLYAPGDFTLFLKFNGPVELLRAERAAFRDLATSLRREVAP